MNDKFSLLESMGARIRQLRSARGWTRMELAERAHLSLRFLAQLESGRGNISVSRLAQVAEALNCSLRQLIPASVPRSTPPTKPPSEKKPIVALIGLRGAGKSSVGTRLAKKLHLPFVELDAEIERAASMPLAQIFSMHGENYYRRLELECLDRVLQHASPMVLATGGSIVTDARTWNVVRQKCTTVWLRATPEVYWRRLLKQGDTRPMKGNPAAMTELRALLKSREPLYAQADYALDTSKRTLPQTTEAILKRLRSR